MSQLAETVNAEVFAINEQWNNIKDAMAAQDIATLDWEIISENLRSLSSKAFDLGKRCEGIELALSDSV